MNRKEKYHLSPRQKKNKRINSGNLFLKHKNIKREKKMRFIAMKYNHKLSHTHSHLPEKILIQCEIADINSIVNAAAKIYHI